MLSFKIKRALPGFDLSVDLSVNAEILSILGPSGSGKTMTLKCIAGLIQPDEGHIELNGRVLFDSESRTDLPARQRKIGFVFQDYALFPHLTVNDNIAYGISHLPRNEVNERVSSSLEMMHIQGLGKRFPRQLSSGQQQRVALARALANEPEVILLDEPFSALDTPRREWLELELLALQDYYHGDILFVTHDLAQGYKLGSRIAVFEAGKIVQCDNKRNVITSPANRTAARLTGVKNLFEGQVTEMDGKEVTVLVPELGKPLAVLVENSANISLGQNVTVGIRPENIQICEQPGGNSIVGRVSQVVEGVTSLSCYFHIDTGLDDKHDIEATFSNSPAPPLARGSDCRFNLPPEFLVIIPR